jgi:hypothetical protein
MLTKSDVIRAALGHFPDNDLLPVEIDRESIAALYQAARCGHFGDTLAAFVVIELFEGVDEGPGGVDMEQALGLIRRAIADLESAAAGIA